MSDEARTAGAPPDPIADCLARPVWAIVGASRNRAKYGNVVYRDLRAAGYRVLTAADGTEAIEVARRERPKLVVLDVMMPTMTGWEVARELRGDPVTQPVKIIMLTAIGPAMNEMTSPLYGADAYLDKPFEFTALEAEIARLLGR